METSHVGIRRSLSAEHDLEHNRCRAIIAGEVWRVNDFPQISQTLVAVAMAQYNTINGGLNGYDNRLAHWERAKKVLT